MSELIAGLRSVGPARLAAIGGILLLFGVFFIFLFVRLSAPLLVPLYADLPASEIDKITGELSRMQYEYRLRDNGQTLLVPSENVPEIRLALAERGLPLKADLGNELFDREQGIGVSSFIQEFNRKRALEGELARSIASLETVQGARVHLVLPERKLFSREEGKARASIVLRMRGAFRLDKNQIAAIQHLVSSSVPELSPDDVSIIDGRGSLLAAGSAGAGAVLEDSEAIRIDYEERLKNNIENLLQNTIGFGKVRAEVFVDMDFSEVRISEQTFDPDRAALRSAEVVEEENSAVNLEPDQVSTEVNLPDSTDIRNQVGSQETVNRTEERNNFEVPTTTRTEILSPGRVKRISVAVLVDGRYVTDAEGNRVYEARSAEELASLEQLVQSSIGYDANGRGDSVQVVNMQFAEPVLDPESLDNKIFGFGTNQVTRLFEAGILVVFGILVIVLLVRPLLHRIFTEAPSALAGGGGYSDEEYQRALETGEYVGDDRARMLADSSNMVRDAQGKLVPISSGFGTDKAEDSILDDIGLIIEERPEDAVEVIRHWIYEAEQENV